MEEKLSARAAKTRKTGEAEGQRSKHMVEDEEESGRRTVAVHIGERAGRAQESQDGPKNRKPESCGRTRSRTMTMAMVGRQARIPSLYVTVGRSKGEPREAISPCSLGGTRFTGNNSSRA